MPFIDSKITVPVPAEKKEVLKNEFGKAMSLIGKPESFLMVGFEDNYDLYMTKKNKYMRFGDSELSKNFVKGKFLDTNNDYGFVEISKDEEGYKTYLPRRNYRLKILIAFFCTS